MISFARRISIGFALLLCALPAFGQGASDQDQPSAASQRSYTEVFYQSGDLKIQAYLYKPEGVGPFPVVIYNHGSRIGRERRSIPWEFVGRMLAQAGFLALVPERRGYGRSDGPGYSGEGGYGLIQRLQSETDDVLAAVEYLKGVPSADTGRMGIVGWSFGGIVTMLAISRSSAFRAAVDQAGGALTWPSNPSVRDALITAAQKTNTPVLLLVAISDRTTESVTTLARHLQARNVPHQLIVYGSSGPIRGKQELLGLGHRVFSEQGAEVWRDDVIEFLNRYLKPVAASQEKPGQAAVVQ
jgi:dienelactone hydrolase